MVTLEQAIEEEKFKAEYCRKLEKIIRGENPVIFYDEIKSPEIEYHEQVAEWLEELRELKKEREER